MGTRFSATNKNRLQFRQGKFAWRLFLPDSVLDYGFVFSPNGKALELLSAVNAIVNSSCSH